MYNSWSELKIECEKCKKCVLCQTKTNLVFGTGNEKSEVLLVGEGPGEQEDLQGKPFVGRSGKLLDEMLNLVGLDRNHNVYIANIVKCRPPKNRDPLPEEQECCIDWLRNQVILIKPKIIVTLGRIAAARIIKEDIKITREHGIFYIKNNIYMMPMFHPAAILRNPNQKTAAINDFFKLKQKIQKTCGFLYN